MTIERPNTLAGLVEKRAEIAGQIAHTRAMLRQLIIDLDHVDAAIRLFDPNYDVEGIRQKIPTNAHRAIRGDMTRATLDALRDAPGPMTTQELARHVMAERGLIRRHNAVAAIYSTHRRFAPLAARAWHPAIDQRSEARPLQSLGDRGLAANTIFLV
jgi:hypothetical protein